ncbi:MAG: LysM peptidoglycan-binding domain-containing protein [Bdellovibrionaceae bacterium]|nr:LysM peptidoglycan-binding domain-containing protein [Pseudobdellovibrionaceae bacterium]
MFRKYLLLLLFSLGLFILPGCSLFSSDSDQGDEAVSEESTSDGESDGGGEDVVADESEPTSDLDSGSTSDNTEELALNTGSDEEEVLDDYPDDDYGGTTTSTDATSMPDQPLETNSEETLYVGEDSAGGKEATDTSSDTPMYTEDTTSTAAADATTYDTNESAAAPAFTPVKKMKHTPYMAGGVLLNRLYIARSGDTMSSVAQKIYGDSGRKKDLVAWNSHFAGKSLKVGDKVYYNSPRNPADNSQILLYYEEAGIQPSMYTAQQGDSIRKVSKNLLGDSRSWMEVWATNEVESKWQIPAGTTLRYWPDGAAAGAAPVQQAAVEEPQAAPQEELPAPTEDAGAATNVAGTAGDEMEAPTEDFPADDGGGEDAGAAGQVAQNEEPPPPPPTEMQAPPPPPPAEPMAPPQEVAQDSSGLAGLMNGQDDSTMIAVLGGLLLVAAFILLIFLKRGRKKASYTST